MKVAVDKCWSERSGRVQTATSEVDTDQLSNEQSKTDTDRGNERCSVLLGSKHEDREDKLRSQEHLNEKSLNNSGASSKLSLNSQRPREHAGDQCCSGHASEDLDEEEQNTTEPGNSTDETHADCDSRVEADRSSVVASQVCRVTSTYSPPEIRKKTQAFTARENPKHNAMYCNCCGLLPLSATVKPADDGMLFAT